MRRAKHKAVISPCSQQAKAISLMTTNHLIYYYDGMIKKQKPKDKLFLLMPDFIDPKFPGRRFYCWHCALIEGVLSAFPNLAEQLEVERVAWPRPRKAVVPIVGEENQSLPLLVLADGTPSKFQTGTFGKLAFINDKDKILAALAERYGFPEPHP